MKLLHIADLHLGKTFHKVNILKDQAYVLQQIVKIMDETGSNMVIAGDVFDSVNPSLEAQELFLNTLKEIIKVCEKHKTHCYITVGNHDSARRVMLWKDFVSEYVTITDDFCIVEQDGVKLCLLPFIKPVLAELKFNEDFDSYTSAYNKYLDMVDDRTHTVLVTHQTFEGCTTGSSETMSFFDDAIPLSSVTGFPLVIAGHIHKQQRLWNVYYSGSLLPYAFGDKAVENIYVWDIPKGCNGPITKTEHPVKYLHNLRIIEGDLKHVLEQKDSDDFIMVKLIEENLAPDVVMNELKAHFTHLLTVAQGNKDMFKADITKPTAQFKTFEEAVDSFCKQIDIPVFNKTQIKYILEALHEVTNITD